MPTQTVAIVTSASQGIGKSTALRLSRDFTSLVFVARNKAALEETAAQIKSASNSTKTLILALDLSDPATPDIVVTQTLTTFGRIDSLLNIAGDISRSG